MLGREYKNKVNTVMALQRNFAVVSKLCQSEQAEKEKVMEQSREFKRQFDDKVDQCCRLYEEIEQLKQQAEEMKKKAGLGEKAG